MAIFRAPKFLALCALVVTTLSNFCPIELRAESCRYEAKEIVSDIAEQQCYGLYLNQDSAVLGECIILDRKAPVSVYDYFRNFYRKGARYKVPFIFRDNTIQRQDFVSADIPYFDSRGALVQHRYWVGKPNASMTYYVNSDDYNGPRYVRDTTIVRTDTYSYFQEYLPVINDAGIAVVPDTDDSSGGFILKMLSDDTLIAAYGFPHMGKYIPSGVDIHDINRAGEAVGFAVYRYEQPFILRNNRIRLLPAPGKGGVAFVINDRGDVGGYVNDLAYRWMPFLWKNGKAIRLPIPYRVVSKDTGAKVAAVVGINNKGHYIVEGGVYSSNPERTGGAFLVSGGKSCAVYGVIKRLFGAGAVAQVRGFNNKGQVLLMASIRNRTRTFILSPLPQPPQG